jgi:RNA polymerase sigma-70 factor, ECF subfamily
MAASSLSRALSLTELGEDLCAGSPSSPLEAEVAELFEHMRDPLLRYLLSLGLPIDDGEEIVQEAFLALFRHLRRERSRTNLKGWMFRVVHNLGLKKRTRNSLHLQRYPQGDFESSGHADPAPSIEQQLLSRQKAQRLQTTLRTIPEQDRFCLYLRAEGLRYREIAEVLGISLGGVALSLQRSLGRLRSAEMRKA